MLERFKQITTFIFDVDGVLTNGGIALPGNGHQERTMNIKDGFALQLAVKKGYRILVLSGGDSQEVVLRLQKLGISDIHLNIKDKVAEAEKFIHQHQLETKEILFMGDDLPDLPLMHMAGLPCAPHDAAPEIRTAARYISRYDGGSGCVRDVIEKVLKLNQHWQSDVSIASK